MELVVVLDIDDGHAAIASALHANVMRQMIGTAGLALGKLFERERVMSAALVASAGRDTFLR
jgi:hypothetical protein